MKDRAGHRQTKLGTRSQPHMFWGGLLDGYGKRPGLRLGERPFDLSGKLQGPIGQPLKRREDARFLTGAGQYTDDVVLPGRDIRAMVHYKF